MAWTLRERMAGKPIKTDASARGGSIQVAGALGPRMRRRIAIAIFKPEKILISHSRHLVEEKTTYSARLGIAK